MTYKQVTDRMQALQRELMKLGMETLVLFRKVKDKGSYGARDAYGMLQNLHSNIQNRHRRIREVLLYFEGHSPNEKCDGVAMAALSELEEALDRYLKDYEYALGRSRI